MLRDDLLGEHGDAPDGDEREVECGLLVLHERAVERAALMTGVGADDGEAARKP